MLKIPLCVKQVPDKSNIKWTENNTMQREGVESIINPYDVYAAEFALNIKEKLNNEVEITAFTMGPIQAQEMLKKLIAIGVDEGVLISDKKFAGSDTYATGKTLAASIKSVIPDFDLIICGQFAIDGDTAQTGPCIASFLNIPQITYVKNFENINEKSITLIRELDEGIEKVEVNYPALICVLQDVFEPRRPLINGIKFAQNKQIKILTQEDINLAAEECGLKGSPTYVSKAFRNMPNHNAKIYQLSIDESIKLFTKKFEEFCHSEQDIEPSLFNKEDNHA